MLTEVSCALMPLLKILFVLRFLFLFFRQSPVLLMYNNRMIIIKISSVVTTAFARRVAPCANGTGHWNPPVKLKTPLYFICQWGGAIFVLRTFEICLNKALKTAAINFENCLNFVQESKKCTLAIKRECENWLCYF